MGILIDGTSATLDRALDVSMQRHALLAGNIANVDTPGYQPRDLTFQGALESAVQEVRGPSGATELAGPSAPEVYTRPEVTDTLDGNGVDIDREVARLADNSLRYRATLELARRRYALVRDAISGMRNT